MPVVVMENIIGLLDFRSVLTLRQVCRDFWNFIDDLKDSKLPDSKLKGLTLTIVDPKFLVELNFRPRFFAFETDEISKTEQWKMAKVFAEDVIHLKECFMKSSTFKYCYLTMNSPTSEIEDFVKLWGPSDVSGTDEKWYFRMVNSDILVVSVELEDTWPYRTDFNLFRKKISDIESDRVFIHD
ncbi:Protein CBG22869 [Caenorhabditis briggsae]|uniref:Protein CBG22869 n=1 Tax=Caenorhabditis briggsae TaxID=6238 RepID=A8Y392_CAEBR|nr:Protein CBG22869 [Caenorhabditis briggsae]CAP39361.2 Protein CBG22869 [Caenorhabditis briggsae]